MIIFAATTGLRRAEWIALEKRDAGRDARVVYVRRAFTKGELKVPKTEATIRAVRCRRERSTPSTGSAARANHRKRQASQPTATVLACSGRVRGPALATACHRLRPRGSRKGPSFVVCSEDKAAVRFFEPM
jgi:integrase